MVAMVYVGGTTANIPGSAGTTNTVSLTGLTGGAASAAAAGDIVVVGYSVSNTGTDRTLAITDGTNPYTLIGSELYQYSGFVASNLRVAYKVMGATPDTTVSIGPTGNASDAGVVAVHVWRNVNATPIDVTTTTATGNGTSRPNPPSITPVSAGAIILAFGASASIDGSAALTNSGDLTNFIAKHQIGITGSEIGVGSKAWTSGAFDPAQFTGGTPNANDAWTALTVALRPDVERIYHFERQQYLAYTRI